MARKVFISFLGIGTYDLTKYQMPNNGTIHTTQFVQEAILDDTCEGWSNDDKIYIFLTEGAKNKNWLNNGDPEYGLQHILKQKTWEQIIEPVDYDEKDSVWKIFETVYGKLQVDDEIYFDVTHAFRTIPMFSMVLFNYSRFMLNTSLKRIYYGEYIKGQEISPVKDLTDIALLQQYTEVASAMKNFGRVAPIKDVIASSTSELNDVFKQLSGSIENFDNSLQVNDYKAIEKGKDITGLRNSLIAAKRNKEIPSAFREILTALFGDIEKFNDTSSYRKIEAAINWCIRYKMFQQAYTLGREYILTRLYDLYKSKNPYLEDGCNKQKRKETEKYFREYLSSICSIKDEDVKQGNYERELGKYPELTDWFLQQTTIKDIRPCYQELGNKRNIINHAKGTMSYEDLALNPDNNIIAKCIAILEEKPEEQPENIFVNLTNHPASEWDDKQREEAEKKYGRIIDLQFPDVAPDASEKTISRLADEYLEKVLELSKGSKPTVHIMGEMTLTLSLVERLKAENISCVASTTERKVQELPSGEKISQFKFVRFRRY